MLIFTQVFFRYAKKEEPVLLLEISRCEWAREMIVPLAAIKS